MLLEAVIDFGNRVAYSMKEESRAATGAVRFGVFEIDLKAGELRKRGIRIRVQDQPYQILQILLERPGEVVTREELQQRIWPTNTFVDFDHGLNNAIKRLREALGDSADNPRFVETLPRRGYRFIYPVEVGEHPRGAPALSETPREGRKGPPLPGRWAIPIGVFSLLAVVAVLFALNVAGLRDRMFPRPVPRIESIAVLPLENLSHDREQEYFADGMTDELITNLGQIRALRVISRSSIMRYKHQPTPAPQVAKELNVDAVVEGTVVRSAGRVRITAQLIDARNDRHLWARSYERDLRDVLALQREVARSIAEQIRVTLTPREQARLASARLVNLKAHDAYLQGRFHLNKWGVLEWRKAIDLFRQAAEEDPNDARACVGIADADVKLIHFLPAREVMPAGRAAAMKALALDETLAEAHRVVGEVKFRFEWDWSGAEKEFQRALELNPNLAQAHLGYGEYLRAMMRLEEAMKEYQRAQELDPLSADAFVGLAETYVEARQYDRAIEQFHRALEIDPNHAFAHWYLKDVYEHTGMYRKAVTEWQRAVSLLGRKEVAEALGRAYARSGYKGARQEWLKALKASPKQLRFRAFLIAAAYKDLGERDRAFEWLQKSYEERDGSLAFLNTPPYWDDYRSDPRFQDVLRRIGLPQ